jgi:hypothetical protein
MGFQVGINEPHTVAIEYHQSLKLLRVTVRNHERHLVQLNKTRQRVNGDFKPQQFVASVDGIVVARAAR